MYIIGIILLILQISLLITFNFTVVYWSMIDKEYTKKQYIIFLLIPCSIAIVKMIPIIKEGIILRKVVPKPAVSKIIAIPFRLSYSDLN